MYRLPFVNAHLLYVVRVSEIFITSFFFMHDNVITIKGSNLPGAQTPGTDLFRG